MATFSVNQVRNLYVAKADSSNPKTLGDLAVMENKDANDGKPAMWFEYVGFGGKEASDKITIANIVSAKATKSDDMAKKLKRVKVTVAPEALTTGISSGNIIAGQDYILRLAFTHFVGQSDEDMYWKYGMVHGFAGMKPDAFYKALAYSLVQNLSRDDNKLVKVYVHSASKAQSYGNSTLGTTFADGFMEVTTKVKDNGKSDNSNPYYVTTAGLVDDIDSIEIEEVEQPWALGTIPQSFIPFTAQPMTVEVNGDEVIWGKVEKSSETPAVVKNGHLIADLEYFCMGERGDVYRNVGWPNVIHTQYMVDPAKAYDTLDITYYYAGDNEDVQKSQKTITIVADDASHTIINAIIGKVNTATGLTIATL